MEYTIKFSQPQLQALIDVINHAPVARIITDPLMETLEKQVVAQEKEQLKKQPNGSTVNDLLVRGDSGSNQEENNQHTPHTLGRTD